MMLRRVLGLVGLMTSMLTMMASPAQAAADWYVISAGGQHSCAIRVGQLYCWGYNQFGEIGTGASTVYYRTPRQVNAATNWATVTTGDNFTCGIRAGIMYCWGDNYFGQVGRKPTRGYVQEKYPTPQQVTSATDWKTVAASGDHVCAIRSVGKLYCWGANTHGQLGTGDQVERWTPTPITSATDWKRISAGSSATCAIRVGKLYCWGDAPDVNQYCDPDDSGCPYPGPTGPGYLSPRQLTTATDWSVLNVGGGHACAIRVGKLYCWGTNQYGALGAGQSYLGGYSPRQITTATDWAGVNTGGAHTCAIRVHKLYCWGANEWGQVGAGTSTETYWTALRITTAADWDLVNGGSEHTCAIRVGNLYCWGHNESGEVGIGATTAKYTVPKRVTLP